MSYYEDPEKFDKVRVVMEIASLYDTPAASKARKGEIVKQLYGYMLLLGDEGRRWDKDVLGVGVVGTEVCFIRPVRVKNMNVGFTYGSEWCNLFDGQFVAQINRMAQICSEDDD